MSAEETLQQIRQSTADLERRRAKREADFDNADARLKDAVKKLKEEFGVSSLEEAREELGKMQASLDESASEALRLLQEAST